MTAGPPAPAGSPPPNATAAPAGPSPPDATQAPAGSAPLLAPVTITRTDLRWEIWAVFMISLGASAVRALLYLVDALSRPGPLSGLVTTIVSPVARDRPWLDATYQLAGIGLAVMPVVLVGYLLHRSGESFSALGVDRREPVRDLLRGAGLAAAVGGSGLALYLAAHALGLNLTVRPTDLPGVWWAYPVLVASAWENALLEEVVVLGYLLHRLDQLGWRPWRAVALSALVRGTYHLYQGFGGFAGNVLMGTVFGVLYRRWGRAMPMLVAHGLIDTVTFVGYQILRDRVSWLP